MSSNYVESNKSDSGGKELNFRVNIFSYRYQIYQIKTATKIM